MAYDTMLSNKNGIKREREWHSWLWCLSFQIYVMQNEGQLFWRWLNVCLLIGIRKWSPPYAPIELLTCPYLKPWVFLLLPSDSRLHPLVWSEQRAVCSWVLTGLSHTLVQTTYILSNVLKNCQWVKTYSWVGTHSILSIRNNYSLPPWNNVFRLKILSTSPH